MWLLRHCFPEKGAFACLLMCTHGVETLLPALWLPLLFPAWAAQAAWAGSPSERISNAAWAWRCAHLCSARHKPTGSERWMAGTSRCHPSSSYSAASSWGRVGENTAKLYLLHHIRIYSLFCVCVSVLCIPAYRMTAIFILFSDTDTVYTTSRQHSEKQKYMNIHK